MANIIIKSDERREYERQVAESFGIRGAMSAEQNELAEQIAASTNEVCKSNGVERRY